MSSFLGFGGMGMVADDPLSKVLPNALKTIEADLPGMLGTLLAPDGVVTVLSDQIVMMIVSGLLLMIFFPLFVRKRRGTGETDRLVPSGFGNLIELVCNYLREDVARPLLGEHTDRFVKYIWSVFFFILTMNLIGLIPFAKVTPKLIGLPIGGSPTTNIYITATLALLTFILMVFNGLRLGGKHYIAHFAPGPWWIWPLIVPVEIVGTLAKVVALALRLFAANTAGHLLMASLIGLALMSVRSLGLVLGFPVALAVVVGSVAISMVEIFVAFLQAFIFTYLTSLFIGMSVNVHHDDHHEAGAH